MVPCVFFLDPGGPIKLDQPAFSSLQNSRIVKLKDCSSRIAGLGRRQFLKCKSSLLCSRVLLNRQHKRRARKEILGGAHKTMDEREYSSRRVTMSSQIDQEDYEHPLLRSDVGKRPFEGFIKSFSDVFQRDALGSEIALIALPAIAALAADPLSSLVDTAFIGHIGSVEVAAVGVSITVINLVSKLFNLPLLNVTTSFVAAGSSGDIDEDGYQMKEPFDHSNEALPDFIKEQDTAEVGYRSSYDRRAIPAVSSALVVATILGLFEAILLAIGTWPILRIMGITHDSPMRIPAQQYLAIRAIGAPAAVVSLATEGVFRGFKDTKTPFYGAVIGNVFNVILDPILIFVLGFGVSGAAVATVASQFLIAGFLLWRLSKHVVLLPSSFSEVQFDRFLKSGGLLFARTMAVLLTMTLATSMAARHGVVSMAAHQICMQVWLAASLLSDSLALSGQAIIAEGLANNKPPRVKATVFRVLQTGVVLGLIMTAVLGISEPYLSKVFTEDAAVIKIIHIIFPFVILTQPINAVAFIFDGIFYGAQDFTFSAYSMIVVAVLSSIGLLLVSPIYGITGVWLGLTILMSLRMLTGFVRLGSATGPWHVLTSDYEESA